MTQITLTTATTQGLQHRIKGQLIEPGQPEYETARLAWNRTVEQFPKFIVIPQDAEDVVETIKYAREHRLGVSAQATGHGIVQPSNGTILIRTSSLADVHIDPISQTASVGAGVKWGNVLKEAQEHGLAPLLGSSPDVGAVGYTLGGGMGWLARKYGLAADSVLRFEFVSANGERLEASPHKNADVFWGLRGGGGSIGLITRMDFKLYPVTRVYGGNLFYPIHLAREVFIRYRDWIKHIPDEMTSSILLMNYPLLDDIPEFLRGHSFVMVRGCFCGSVEEGEALLRYWRAWTAPVLDEFRAMPFGEVATISNDPVDPMPGLSTGAWLTGLNDEVITALLQYGIVSAGGPPLVMAEIRHAGGAIARVDPASSAYSHREAQHLLQIVGVSPTPEAHQRLEQHTRSFKDALGPALTGGVYLNFLDGEESRSRTIDGFTPENSLRLMALKTQYDPENRLRTGFDLPGMS